MMKKRMNPKKKKRAVAAPVSDAAILVNKSRSTNRRSLGSVYFVLV